MAAISKTLKYIIITIVSVVFSCRLSAGEAVKRPDLTGVWEAFASEPAFARGEESPLSENGQKLVDAYYAQYGDKFVEPGAYCVPPGMPTTMTALVGYPIEILQSENRVTMLAEMEMQVRRIYLDGRKIPDDYPPTRMGRSRTGRSLRSAEHPRSR